MSLSAQTGLARRIMSLYPCVVTALLHGMASLWPCHVTTRRGRYAKSVSKGDRHTKSPIPLIQYLHPITFAIPKTSNSPTRNSIPIPSVFPRRTIRSNSNPIFFEQDTTSSFRHITGGEICCCLLVVTVPLTMNPAAFYQRRAQMSSGLPGDFQYDDSLDLSTQTSHPMFASCDGLPRSPSQNLMNSSSLTSTLLAETSSFNLPPLRACYIL